MVVFHLAPLSFSLELAFSLGLCNALPSSISIVYILMASGEGKKELSTKTGMRRR